jgi:hypothetical protein
MRHKTEPCPVCGKIPIQVRRYKIPKGDVFYVHRVWNEYGLPHMDGCYVKAALAAAEGRECD